MDPKNWPADTQDWVFLPRALEAIKAALIAEGIPDGNGLMDSVHELARLGFPSTMLLGGMRDVKGGPIIPMPSHLWNLEGSALELRFSGYRFDLEAPYDPPKAFKGRHCYIFVQRLNLRVFIEHLLKRVREERDTQDGRATTPAAIGKALPLSVLTNLTREKATDEETKAAFIKYMNDEMPCTNADEERTLIENRIGKYLDRGFWRETRKELATVPLKQGPRAQPVNYKPYSAKPQQS